MRRRWPFIGGGVIVAAVIAVGVWFWSMSSQPLYEPGMVSDSNASLTLVPPTQDASVDRWLMEEGVELAHVAVGEGRNVLFVHGGPGQPFAEPLEGLSLLADEYRVHYYDQRGSGDSSRPIEAFESSNMYRNMQELEQTLGLSAHIADIERIRRILGDDKIIVVGHSWGGLLASLYAAEFPDHVEKLVLIAPANMLVMPMAEEEGDLFANIREGLPVERHEAYDAFVEEYFAFGALFEKSEDELVALSEELGGYFAEAMEAEFPFSKRPGGWMVWAQYMSMGRRHDYRDALRDVEAPVLVIHGANDFVQMEAASRQYAQLYPNANFVVIEGATHFPFSESPEEFAKIVREFLDAEMSR